MVVFDTLPTLQKEKCACFTGPRPAAMPGGDGDTILRKNLIRAIELSVENGIETFFNGCQAGYDIMAAEQVIQMKNKHPHIRSFCIKPFQKSFCSGYWWTEEWRQRLTTVVSNSDFSLAMYEHEQKGVYYERNRMMVDNSALVIAYCPRQSGGTWYTVSYAMRTGVDVRNLALEGHNSIAGLAASQ